MGVQQCPSEDEHRSCNRAPWSCLCFCRGWLSQRWLWWIWLWRIWWLWGLRVWKEIAEAEADAEPGYSRGYGGYGYGGYGGYGRGYYGKRDADAVADADAEPWSTDAPFNTPAAAKT